MLCQQDLLAPVSVWRTSFNWKKTSAEEKQNHNILEQSWHTFSAKEQMGNIFSFAASVTTTGLALDKAAADSA